MDDESADDIDSLEQRIEGLTAEIRRCGKISLAARLLIWAGAVALALMLVGLIPLGPEILLAALSAVIGGIVLLGSNASSWEKSERALRQAEALRAELIGRMPLRLVGEDRPTPQ